MTPAAQMLGLSGLVLFAIGLLLGFAIPRFTNSRMGLSAHLTAAQTGPALIAIALFWKYCSVPDRWDWLLAIALAASAYALVAGIAVAAVTGASSALPMAGKGYTASLWQERAVTGIVGLSSLVMVLAVIALCWFALSGL